MARTKDPNGLDETEAKEFRALIQEVRELKDCTWQQVADAAELSPSQVTNAMKDDRTILADLAVAILKGIGTVKFRPFGTDYSRDDFQRGETLLKKYIHGSAWLARYRAMQDGIPALISAASAEQLAAIIVSDLVKERAIGESKRDTVAYALTRSFKRHGYAWARSWYQSTAASLQRTLPDHGPGRNAKIDAMRDTLAAAATIAQPKSTRSKGKKA